MNGDVTIGQKPASILIVDDVAANLQVLTGMLDDRGYLTRPVTSGKMALLAAQNDPPDLVLLDITMPGMDGYEVCARMKANEKLKDIPVIFISALHETLDKVKGPPADTRREHPYGLEVHTLLSIGRRLARLSLDRQGPFCDVPARCLRPWRRPGADVGIGAQHASIPVSPGR